MMLPFGIAVYPDVKPSSLAPLPRLTLTRTYHESVTGRIEHDNGRLLQLEPRRRKYSHPSEDAEYGVSEIRSMRGAPGRETSSIRRRPITVRRELADVVQLAVLTVRRNNSRKRIAQAIGVTPRQLHYAELGWVQSEALHAITTYFGIDAQYGYRVLD